MPPSPRTQMHALFKRASFRQGGSSAGGRRTAIDRARAAAHHGCRHKHDEGGVLQVAKPQLEEALGRNCLELVGAKRRAAGAGTALEVCGRDRTGWQRSVEAFRRHTEKDKPTLKTHRHRHAPARLGVRAISGGGADAVVQRGAEGGGHALQAARVRPCRIVLVLQAHSRQTGDAGEGQRGGWRARSQSGGCAAAGGAAAAAGGGRNAASLSPRQLRLLTSEMAERWPRLMPKGCTGGSASALAVCASAGRSTSSVVFPIAPEPPGWLWGAAPLTP